MSNWNASQYLKFGDQRTRAAVDLVSRVNLDSPTTIVDLGCGPGNSTQVLRNRWPTCEIIGIDSSTEMIEAARRSWPEQTWQVTDIAQWNPPAPRDLVYSNAALQWLPNHAALIPALFHSVAPHGALAFQIPSSTYATVRTLIHDVAEDSVWRDRMSEPLSELTMETPAFYYDILSPLTTELDIWETEYVHVMQSPDAIIDWIASTGLRPFLNVLADEEERNAFVAKLRERVHTAYPPQADSKVLFPFRRTFVVAYR